MNVFSAAGAYLAGHFGNLSGFDAMVVLTSISLVFAMLLALCVLLSAQGRLFDALTARRLAKRQKTFAPPRAAQDLAVPAPAPVPAASAAPAADGAIPPEIVAAIAAAVYCLEGEQAVVRGIRRLPAAAAPRRRGVWGDTGVAHNVRPF